MSGGGRLPVVPKPRIDLSPSDEIGTPIYWGTDS